MHTHLVPLKYTTKLGSADADAANIQKRLQTAWFPLLTSQGQKRQGTKAEGNTGSWGVRATRLSLLASAWATKSVGRGQSLSRGKRSPSVFYLLFYFRLVVQVMSVGVSVGQGSMKADFLVMKRGVGSEGGGSG